MLSKAAIPYEKVVLVPTTLKMTLDQVPADTTLAAFNLCVQRAGGLPQNLAFDPPVFTKHEDGHALRVRFYSNAECYVDENSRVLASVVPMYDAFALVFAQQNAGMVVG